MPKAITGAVEIAAGVTALALIPGGGALLLGETVSAATAEMVGIAGSVILSGVGQEVGAIADAIMGNPGMPITVRQAASPRRIIYGTQRVGGVEVFESTTGSSKDQYNMVIVFCAHEITNYLNLYLDGRQVYWNVNSAAGYTVRNGIGFGGGGDGNTYIGPDGSHYQFDDADSGHSGVLVVPRFGDQAAGDYIVNLTNNDSRWGPDGKGNAPSLMGCAYLYVKVEYDPNVFPSKPDIKATIKGKAIYDPRTGETAYSENWALVVADIIKDPIFGLGDSVNEEQLIAAANICDEEVTFYGSGGGTEARYTANFTYTTDTPVGEVLQALMDGVGGRLAFVGGEWFIYPGTFYGSSASFDSSSLIDTPSWSSQRSFRDKVNRVQGTYIAPNYPYAVAGDLYDSNGWYNGTEQNNFPFAFQPTNYPMYACDTLHGYAADQYLTEDGGVELPLNLDFSTTLSIVQAQRVAKIALLRNRQQGSGVLTFGPEALVLQPNDTFEFTFPQRNWSSKLLEVQKMETSIAADESGAPLIQVKVYVNETDSSVYVWNDTDELSPYDVPVITNQYGMFETAPPTSLALVSDAGTGVVQPDGTVQPRIQVNWDTPADVRVTQIQIQYQLITDTVWTNWGAVPVTSNTEYFNAIAGATYNVQIRSLRANGATSAWVEVTNFTASDSLLSASVSPPTNVTLEDDPTTALLLADGTSMSRLLISWTPPNDSYVTSGGHIQIQYQLSTTGTTEPSVLSPTQNSDGTWTSGWVEGGTVTGNSNFFYLDGIEEYQQIAVQIRAVRANGATSEWVEATNGGGTGPIHVIGHPAPRFGGALQYSDGKTLDSLEPIEKGADVTLTHPSNGVTVDGTTVRSASDIIGTINNGGGVALGYGSITGQLPYANHSTIIQAAIGSTGEVQNLGGVAAGSITPISTLMPAGPNADNTLLNGLTLLTNPSFEAGASGWTAQSGWTITNSAANAYRGSWCAIFQASSSSALTNNATVPCQPGDVISASCMVNCIAGTGQGGVRINFYSTSGSLLSEGEGLVSAPAGAGYQAAYATGTAPVGTAYFQIDAAVIPASGTETWSVDNFQSSIRPRSLDEVSDSSTRYAAAESGANVTNAHVLTAKAIPTNQQTTLTTETEVEILGLGFSLVASGSEDVYNLFASIQCNGGQLGEFISISVYLDGESVLTQPYYPNGEFATFPFFASISGLSAGAHTIQFYGANPSNSGSAVIYPTGTYAICQRIF